jgi:hypothetical protein
VSPHKPEHFLVCFDYSKQRDTALRAGSGAIGSTTFLLHPWRLDSYTRPADWPFHAKICIQNLPLHTWSAEGVRQALGDICIFDYMEAPTFRQEDTTILSFFAWMKNHDLLLCSKEVTFFSECASRFSGRDGPPPVDAPLTTSPVGRDAMLLIHLGHYYNWTLLPLSSIGFEVSSLPSSSSPRMLQPCHRPPTQGRQDEDLEDDSQGATRQDWRRNINSRGRPIDDFPRAAGHSARQCTCSPRRCRHGGAADSGSEGRGQSPLLAGALHAGPGFLASTVTWGAGGGWLRCSFCRPGCGPRYEILS